MRAMVIDEFGSSDRLRIGEVPCPAPADDEVLIRVAYAAVNPADWKERAGHVGRGRVEYTFPHILGWDASGVVEAVGKNVTGFSPGQKVVTCSNGPAKWGTYAEFVTAREDRVGPMAASLDFANASAYPLATLTIWQDLFGADRGALTRGQSVLIHGGAGGLGSYGIQMAKAAGLEVAATCRTANTEYVSGLGADCVIDYLRENVVEALRTWKPGGVDVVIDAVGPATLPDALELLRPAGRLVSVATLTDDGDIAGAAEEAKRRGFEKIWAVMSIDGVGGQLAEIGRMFDKGELTPPPITVFPLEQAGEAHRLVETGHVRGKLVLDVSGSSLDGQPA